MSPKEIFTQLSLWIVNYGNILNLTYFVSHFILNLHVWIVFRIQKAPEYRSNTDPDPQHWRTESRIFNTSRGLKT